MLIQEHIALGEIMFCNIRTDNTAEMFTMFLILKQVSCVQTKMECEKERGKSVSDRIMASVRYSADENVFSLFRRLYCLSQRPTLLPPILVSKENIAM